MLPPISYGLNLHHIDFPGTIHIEPEVFIAFCLNITKSVAYHGFQKILLVNGHGSNAPLIDLIARKTVLATKSLCFACGYYFLLPMEQFEQIRETQVMAHADEFETSLYLHLAAGAGADGQGRRRTTTAWASTSAATARATIRPLQRLLVPLDRARRPRRAREGDRRERAEIIFEAAVTGMIELVDEFRAWPIAERRGISIPIRINRRSGGRRLGSRDQGLGKRPPLRSPCGLPLEAWRRTHAHPDRRVQTRGIHLQSGRDRVRRFRDQSRGEEILDFHRELSRAKSAAP